MYSSHPEAETGVDIDRWSSGFWTAKAGIISIRKNLDRQISPNQVILKLVCCQALKVLQSISELVNLREMYEFSQPFAGARSESNQSLKYRSHYAKQQRSTGQPGGGDEAFQTLIASSTRTDQMFTKEKSPSRPSEELLLGPVSRFVRCVSSTSSAEQTNDATRLLEPTIDLWSARYGSNSIPETMIAAYGRI
ncbi:MAG: hypothetical protein M1837_005682 [Sclerophora amabilis]|nr:MAG: hypothetical protein M1837_005682 [Sclerophora amabilis]